MIRYRLEELAMEQQESGNGDAPRSDPRSSSPDVTPKTTDRLNNKEPIYYDDFTKNPELMQYFETPEVKNPVNPAMYS